VTGYLFVHDHLAEFDTNRMCELVEVSRSGFYDWRDRPMSDRDLDNAYLANEIHTIFTASRCTYGAPAVWVLVRSRNGTKYITTEADSTSKNNLDNLPECSKA